MTGCVLPSSVRSPSHAHGAVAAGLDAGRAEGDVAGAQHLVVDRLRGCSRCRRRRAPASRRCPPAREASGVGVERDARSAVARRPRASPPSRSRGSGGRARPWRRRRCARCAPTGCRSPARACRSAGIAHAPKPDDPLEGADTMAVELDHSFTTGKPIDESYAGDPRPRARRPAASRAASVLERTGPDVGQGRDPGEDGRDVDDVHGHGRGRRAGRRGAPRGAARQVQGGGRPGLRERRRHVRRSNDGGGTIHTNAQITGKAASMGEGVVVGVLDALINGLHRQARRRSERRPMARSRCDRSARARCRRDGGHRGPGRSRPARVPRQRPRRLRVRRVRQRARRGDGRRSDDQEGPRPLRALLDGQRRRSIDGYEEPRRSRARAEQRSSASRWRR